MLNYLIQVPYIGPSCRSVFPLLAQDKLNKVKIRRGSLQILLVPLNLIQASI